MFLRRTQRQRKGVHTPLLSRTKLGRQHVMHRPRPGNAADALKRRAHQQHTIVRLATGRSASVSRVTGTVILDLQQRRRKLLRQQRPKTIGASGGRRCHLRSITALANPANTGLPVPWATALRTHYPGPVGAPPRRRHKSSAKNTAYHSPRKCPLCKLEVQRPCSPEDGEF